MLNGLISSSFSRGNAFNYVVQVPGNQTLDPSQAIIADQAGVQLQVDFGFRKRFFEERLSASVWGRNILADPFVEVYNQYGWVNFPHQVHRTIDGDLEYQF